MTPKYLRFLGDVHGQVHCRCAWPLLASEQEVKVLAGLASLEQGTAPPPVSRARRIAASHSQQGPVASSLAPETGIFALIVPEFSLRQPGWFVSIVHCSSCNRSFWSHLSFETQLLNTEKGRPAVGPRRRGPSEVFMPGIWG